MALYEHMLGAYNPAVDTGRNSLLEALKQVERRTESSASGWRLLFYGIVFVPPVFCLIGWWMAPIFAIPGLDERIDLNILDALFGVSLVLLYSAFAYSRYLRPIVRKKLDESDLAVRIATGDLVEDSLPNRIPLIWRLTLPRDKTSSLPGTIQRVAWNLDWYLSTPRMFWRWIWIVQPCLLFLWLLLGIDVLLAMTLPVLNLQSVSNSPDFTYIAAMLLSWGQLHNGSSIFIPLYIAAPLPFIHFRRQIWTEELVRHLRERLAE